MCIVLAGTLQLLRISYGVKQHYKIVLIPLDGYVQNMRDVRILKRISDYKFVMDVEDPDTHIRNPFAITFCQSYQPTKQLVEGVTLRVLKYRENQMNFCSDIYEKGFGFSYYEDENGNPTIQPTGVTNVTVPEQTAQLAER